MGMQRCSGLLLYCGILPFCHAQLLEEKFDFGIMTWSEAMAGKRGLKPTVGMIFLYKYLYFSLIRLRHYAEKTEN